MTEPLVDVRDVSVRFGDHDALTHVDLPLPAGCFTGIVGPSGSGKTTLLRAVLGALRPTSGTVHRRPGLRAGYVPQVETVNWSFPVTVTETLLMARTDRSWPWSTRAEKQAVGAVLERLGLDGLGRRHLRALSGGQQQRVFIARALLGDPHLLVLDEPTSGVDVRTRHEVLHLLADLNAEGLAVVLSTHDLNGIAAHLPHLVCLNGTITGHGAPDEVLTSAVLERTFGAPLDVLQHAGMLVVVDTRHGR